MISIFLFGRVLWARAGPGTCSGRRFGGRARPLSGSVRPLELVRLSLPALAPSKVEGIKFEGRPSPASALCGWKGVVHSPSPSLFEGAQRRWQHLVLVRPSSARLAGHLLTYLILSHSGMVNCTRGCCICYALKKPLKSRKDVLCNLSIYLSSCSRQLFLSWVNFWGANIAMCSAGVPTCQRRWFTKTLAIRCTSTCGASSESWQLSIEALAQVFTIAYPV